MHKVAVIIPAYLESLNQSELASLIQCNSILKKYPKILICHSELNTIIYEKHVPELQYEYFDKVNFTNVDTYSRLLLSFEFYSRFTNYDYILIYQLDAWVFRDELDLWCQKGYDYIGSPWFENCKSHEDGSNLWVVGNGGFSLRRISSFLDIFKYNKPLFKISGLHSIYPKKKGFLRKAKRIFTIYTERFIKRNTVNYYINKFIGGEDIFWAIFLMKSEKALYIPKCEEAIDFSFEKSPEYLYELTGNKLPFGCHAWEKHGYNNFWKDYIKLKT